jgi:hypothetical protein
LKEAHPKPVTIRMYFLCFRTRVTDIFESIINHMRMREIFIGEEIKLV